MDNRDTGATVLNYGSKQAKSALSLWRSGVGRNGNSKKVGNFYVVLVPHKKGTNLSDWARGPQWFVLGVDLKGQVREVAARYTMEEASEVAFFLSGPNIEGMLDHFEAVRQQIEA